MKGSRGQAQWYNPARDLVYATGPILQVVLENLSEPTEDLFRYFDSGKPPEHFNALAEALAKFYQGVEERDFYVLLETSGLREIDPDVVRALGGMTLMALLKWHHHGWGEIRFSGEDDPPEDISEYVAAARAAVAHWSWMGLSFWRHPFLWFRHRRRWKKWRILHSTK